MPYITANIDIQLVHKTPDGNFQILSLSDDMAKTFTPNSLQKDDTVGYRIQSYAGDLKIVGKTTADGKILLRLRGLNIRPKGDNAKSIPCWIDYTKLTVNGNSLLNEFTPTCDLKPYTYTMEVKADDEITIQVAWLPHRSDT